MARGMANNEQIQSQAQSEAFDQGFDRTFGERKPVAPGRYIWSAELGRLVSAAEAAEARALDAPIMAGRFYENTQSPLDGSDIGSRRRRAEHMKCHGVHDASDDASAVAARRKREQEIATTGRVDDPQRRAVLRDAVQRIVEMPQARYDREVAKRAREIRERSERGVE